MTSTAIVSQHADVSTAISLLHKWIGFQLHERRLPGVAVGMVYKGDLIWGKGYGFADIDKATPATTDTRYRIASITKTFTAVAIMQLRDAGKLRLDDPVSDYLKWFNLRYEGAPPITIRHLLSHTSGLPRDASVPHWTENVFQSWDEVVKTTQQRQPVNPPLQEYGYSNLGYTLLGGIVEAVTGGTWARYIQTNILNPLGMRDTLVTPSGSDPNIATGYYTPDGQHARKATPFVATNGFSPSASMASSVNDLVKYARFHLSTDENPLLSRHSLREMHLPYWVYKDWAGGYGMGIGSFRIGEWTVSGHSGGYKGYLTQFILCREHGFGVISLTNSLDSDPFLFAERAYKLVLPELLKIDKPARTAKPEWQQFVGTYHDDWGDVEVVIRDGQLQMIYLRFIDLPPIVLEPTARANEFTLKAPNNPWETARFEVDASGKVTRLWTRNEYLLPKK